MREIFIILAIAGAVVAVVYFLLANGQDTEWGLASLAISWAFHLISGYVPQGDFFKPKQRT